MKILHFRSILAGLLFTGLAFLPSNALAISVDLELVLLMDVSGSVTNRDFNLQRDGYEAAFRSAGVISAIENGAIGSIAATLVYWSNNQVQSVGWTQISNSASSNAFADAIATAARPFSGQTGMANAVNFATALFTNKFNGTRNVIDLSGDGNDNTNGCSHREINCVPLQTARDKALASGVDTINALWVADRRYFCTGCRVNPLTYGSTNLIGGANAFQRVVSGFSDFGAGIEAKLVQEITPDPIPEPSTMLLFGTGLAGLGWWRYRKQKIV